MIVLTSRTSPPWLPDGYCEMIAVTPLEPGDARALAGAVTSGALPPEYVDEIAERSDGIPLFVEQLADALAERGNGGVSFGGRGRRPIPATLTELLQARLDASGPSKTVAQIAAVIGREFDPDLVAAVVDRLETRGALGRLDRPVPVHLERLVSSRLVEPSPDRANRLRFHHALVSQAAYESQLLEERPARHEAVAQSMLASEATGRPVDRAVVAQHFDEAGCAPEAILHYLDAAGRGHSVGAFAEAIDQLTRARELLAALPETERGPLELAICLSRGLALASTGGYAAPGVVADFQRAADLCHVLRDSDAAAGVLRALLGLWGYYCAVGDIRRCASTIDAFSDQLSRASLTGGEGSVHACRGVERFIAGDLGAARRHLTAACDVLRDERVDPTSWPLPNDPLAAALAYLSNLELLCGNETAALGAIQSGLARSSALEFPLGPFSVAFVRMYESWVHRMRGSFESASASAHEIVRIGERHGYFDWQMTGRIHLAAAEAAAEPTATALGEMGDAITAWRSLGGEVLLPGLIIERGWGYLRLGDFDRAGSCLEDAEQIQAKGQRLAAAEALRLRAELSARTGAAPPDDVSRLARAALRLAAGQGALLFVLRAGATCQRVDAVDSIDDELRRSFAGAVDAFGTGSAIVRRELGDLSPDDVIGSTLR
jgi:hypothetical protein